jgi:hypothetical protein
MRIFAMCYAKNQEERAHYGRILGSTLRRGNNGSGHLQVPLCEQGDGRDLRGAGVGVEINPGFDLDAALESLVGKGLLQNPHFFKKIYILTAKGKEYITEQLGAI